MLRSLAKAEPALFLQRFPTPVLIDEIQYAPELLSYITMSVDEDRTAGRYWLTGSQQFHLMNGVSKTLAGRVAVVQLLGFSRRELETDASSGPFLPTHALLRSRDASKALTLRDLYRLIWLGSFPALHQRASVDRDLFYSSYVQTCLQRDVRDLANVGDESAFMRFLRASAARTGQMLNMQDFCRDSNINQATGKRWLSILENSGIAYLLEPYHSNVTKRMVKTPKLYFLDTGLAAWLTEWSSPATLEAGAMTGAFFESWVVSEVIKSWWHNGKRAPLYYYRDKDTKEIDLLIHQDGILYLIEIKEFANPLKDAVRHFKALESLKVPIGPGCIVTLVSQSLPITETVQGYRQGYCRRCSVSREDPSHSDNSRKSRLN